jgi:hypothetical protein
VLDVYADTSLVCLSTATSVLTIVVINKDEDAPLSGDRLRPAADLY